MLRPLFFIALALTASDTPHQSPSPLPLAPAGPTYHVVAKALPRIQAPADEYFGRYMLSTFGVRNAIYDMTVEGNSPLALPLQSERIEAVQAALVDWAEKYPSDPWLPSSIVKFSNFLIGKQRADDDRIAMAFLDFLQWTYPKTWYAKYARSTLASFDLHPQADMLTQPGPEELEQAYDRYLHSVGIRSRR